MKHQRRRALDLFDGLTLAALSSLAMWIAVTLWWRARSTGRSWTGTDGPYLVDQMQYLSWVNDASGNGLIGNWFQLGDHREVFLHPGLLVSGLLHRVGIPTYLAYLAWKPVAVLALFFACRAYVARLVVGLWPQRVALVLALFAISPLGNAANWPGRLGTVEQLSLRAASFDMWPGLYLWGYPFTAIAVALIPATLLAYERGRTLDSWRNLAPVLAFLCAWFQPWQGATVLGLLVGTEFFCWRLDGRGHGRLLAVTVTAGAVPLVYYAMLGHLDAAWQIVSEANNLQSWTWWAIPAAMMPVGLVALLELRRPAPTFHDRALRLWPVVSLTVYVFIAYGRVGTFSLHALQGLSIPLAVLAVRGASTLGLQRLPRPAAVAAGLVAVAVLVQPVVHELDLANATGTLSPITRPQPYLIDPGEQQALDYLDHRSGPGGVLAQLDLGQVVPGLSGRRTWVGNVSWTPSYDERVVQADRLFRGEMPAPEAQAFVRSTGARFLLAGCISQQVDLEPLLRPLISDVRRFGCASVYEVRGPWAN